MKMYSRGFNRINEVENFVNREGIQKENIIEVFQNQDGTYLLLYYAE